MRCAFSRSVRAPVTICVCDLAHDAVGGDQLARLDPVAQVRRVGGRFGGTGAPVDCPVLRFARGWSARRVGGTPASNRATRTRAPVSPSAARPHVGGVAGPAGVAACAAKACRAKAPAATRRAALSVAQLHGRGDLEAAPAGGFRLEATRFLSACDRHRAEEQRRGSSFDDFTARQGGFHHCYGLRVFSIQVASLLLEQVRTRFLTPRAGCPASMSGEGDLTAGADRARRAGRRRAG